MLPKKTIIIPIQSLITIFRSDLWCFNNVLICVNCVFPCFSHGFPRFSHAKFPCQMAPPPGRTPREIPRSAPPAVAAPQTVRPRPGRRRSGAAPRGRRARSGGNGARWAPPGHFGIRTKIPLESWTNHGKSWKSYRKLEKSWIFYKSNSPEMEMDKIRWNLRFLAETQGERKRERKKH